jgi:O-antigen/teichoic acid export membrane protein
MSLNSYIGKRLPKGGFARNVLTLMTGTTIAQAIPVAISPILTRLYTPEDFGILASFIAIISMITALGCFRYELAIPLPENDEDAISLVTLSVLIAFVMSLIFFLIIIFWGNKFLEIIGYREIKKYLLLIPLSFFGVGLYQALSYWTIRKKRFILITRTRVSRSSLQAFMQVLIGFLNSGPIGLIIGDVIGRVGGSGTLLSVTWKEKYR